jgi:hypothetical protein
MSKIFTAHTLNETIEESNQKISEYPCLSCGFYTESSEDCSLDIPECGTSDAADCSSYIKNN